MSPACSEPWKPDLKALGPATTCVLTSAAPGEAREAVLIEAAEPDALGRSAPAGLAALQGSGDGQRRDPSFAACDSSKLSQLDSSASVGRLPGPRQPPALLPAPRALGPPPLAPGSDRCTLRVASLNLGGRNTNPLEFELKGDASETAVEAASMLRRATRALGHCEDGPGSMVSTEREVVDEIVTAIYGSEVGQAPLYGFVQELLHCETWAAVLARVKAKCPYLFNTLNLATLKLKRPSVWEDPASCRGFSNTREYLVAWKAWLCGLDRTSAFWTEDAPRTAKKRDMDAATALSGLLIFDLMCLFSARNVAPSGCEDTATLEEEGREVPFKQIAGLAAKLPSASLTARHGVAEAFIQGMHVVFAQEAREFASCPTVAAEFLAPVSARDNFTAVYLRKGIFAEVLDITEEVADQMEGLVARSAASDSEPAHKAWRTTASRLAAVRCRCLPQAGGFTACLVSLHCSKSDCTAAFIEALRDVLDEQQADVNIAGLDSNCSAEDAGDFQQRLRNAGFDVGCQPKQDQVTVAKRRTSFQTQVRKVGHTDISHKDYIVSWSPRRICRAATAYTPDLRTAYGVEQETKQCVRLPTTQWPFDHCAVTTAFKREPSRRELILRMLCQKRTFMTLCMVCFLLAVLALPPLVSPERRSVFGPPGTWHTEPWAGTPRLGICEAPAPCAEGWLLHEGSCYMTTPRLGHEEATDLCHKSNSELVTITSEAENQFITETICPEGHFCWIGLITDHARENAWWASGDRVTYTRLEHYWDFILPVHPLSHAGEYKPSVLSNLPGEIEGCRWDYTFPLVTGVGLPEVLVEFTVPAVTLAVTAFILLLPRPPHFLTDAYLQLALQANTVWYGCRMWRVCFTTSIGQYRFLENIGNVLDEAMHSATAFLALWMIIRRMSALCPSRHLRVGFAVFFVTSHICVLIIALFVDTTTSISVDSIVVWIGHPFKLLALAVLLLLGVTMSRDLYCASSLMRREAASGKSGQVSKSLTDAIRATDFHFYSILAATISAGFRCGALFAAGISMYSTVIPLWAKTVWTISTMLDSITNDVCAHVLASMNMDGAMIRTKGITNDVMERAAVEVEQHRVAVHVLKAAPTSSQQLCHLAELESQARSSIENGKEDRSFLILQSAVKVETARIHNLMLCVRLRAMTMPVRYQYLIDVPVLEAVPRQHVPPEFAPGAGAGEAEAAAGRYFSWLYSQGPAAQAALFRQVRQLLGKFNGTPWPSELGLAQEQFPWTIWASGAAGVEVRKLLKGEAPSPGDILIHCQQPQIGRRLSPESCTHCVVLEETDLSHVKIHRSGMDSAEEVPREELRICNGGGVFLPGPLKKRQRCLDKVVTDYEDTVAWPPFASLTDLARCTIVLDDPYAMAVLVAYIQANMKVVRLKNRFCEDSLEPVTPETLQALFNHAADHDAETRTLGGASGRAASTVASTAHQYRDISINVEVNANGLPFVCEIQVTLANLAILKHADQNLYSVRRMKSAKELLNTFVFLRPPSCGCAQGGDELEGPA